MAADERNFRSTYYEKVGFRSVEEKRSLEILLKDKPLDRGKLKQFCLRFCVPTTYRNLLWKILLGIVPVQVECHNFIMNQREQEYNDLLHTLAVLRPMDQKMPKSQVFLEMWLLQTGQFFPYDGNYGSEEGLSTIVQSLLHFFESDADVYWIAISLYSTIQKFSSDIPRLIEITHNLLEKEDPFLYRHLKNTRVLENIPLGKWFNCAFAGILHESTLGKIWDKICGGSYKILAYVVVVMLTSLKLSLMKCSDLHNVLVCIKNIPEETSDVIANKSIAMWQQNGSPLTIHDNKSTSSKS